MACSERRWLARGGSLGNRRALRAAKPLSGEIKVTVHLGTLRSAGYPNRLSCLLSGVEDGQLKLMKARRLGDHLDFDDLLALNLEGQHQT